MIKKILLGFSILISVQIWAQCVSPEQLIDMRFEGNTVDSSSYNQSVFEYGTIEYSQDRFGNLNSAVRTTNSSPFLDNFTGNFKCQPPFSFSGWFMPISLNARNPLFTNEDAASVYTGMYLELLPGGQIRVRLGDAGSGTAIFTSAEMVQVGFWSNLVVVVNSLNSVDIYLNGVLCTTSQTGSISSLNYLMISGTSGKIGSGVNGTGTNVFFNGYIDDVKFWNTDLQSYHAAFLYDPHFDGISLDTITICENQSVNISFPYNSCDISWSNGDQDSVCNINNGDFALGSHTIYVKAYDDLNVEFTDSVVLMVDPCLSVAEDEKNFFSFFPNPATHSVQINSEYENYNLEIYDLAGKLILSEIVNSKNKIIDLNGWSVGKYFVRGVSDKEIFTGTFIKE